MSKKRKLKNKTKPRRISIDFGRVTAMFNQIKVNQASGHVETLLDGVPVGAMENASLVVSYDRAKGPKTITRVPIVGPRKLMSPYSFIESFDVVFAVDTNTRVIRNERHSVGAMAILKIQHIERNDEGAFSKVTMNMNMFGCIIRGKNCTGNPEPWVWRTAIKDGIVDMFDEYTESLRVGLVIDSNMGLLEKYNSREIPIHGEYYLPKNITLIYASADSGSDYPLNKLLRICDKEAAIQLDKIEKGIEGAVVETKLTGAVEMVASNFFVKK